MQQSNAIQLKPITNGIPDGILMVVEKEKALENQGLFQYYWRRR